MDGPGVMLMAVDNLPAEMAREASQYFGNALYPFVKQLVSARARTHLRMCPSRPAHVGTHRETNAVVVVWRCGLRGRGGMAKALAPPSGPLPPVLDRAVVASGGHVAKALESVLTPALQRSAAATASTRVGASASASASAGARVKENRQRRVLLLGAGMVAGPLVDYLAPIPHTTMTIGAAVPRPLVGRDRGRGRRPG